MSQITFLILCKNSSGVRNCLLQEGAFFMKSKSFSSIISLMLALVLALSGIMPYMQVSVAELSVANCDFWKIQDLGGTTDYWDSEWLDRSQGKRESGALWQSGRVVCEQRAVSLIRHTLCIEEKGAVGREGNLKREGNNRMNWDVGNNQQRTIGEKGIRDTWKNGKYL